VTTTTMPIKLDLHEKFKGATNRLALHCFQTSIAHKKDVSSVRRDLPNTWKSFHIEAFVAQA